MLRRLNSILLVCFVPLLAFAIDARCYGDVFHPSDIADLGLWLDAGDPLGNGQSVDSGTQLSTWTDKSGLGNHATQTTLNSRPTYVLDGLNGRTSMQFDGINDWYDVPPMFNLNSVTCFLVGQSLPEVLSNNNAFITGRDERFYIWRTSINVPLGEENRFKFSLYGGSSYYDEYFTPADNFAHTFVLQNNGLAEGAMGLVDGVPTTAETWTRSAELGTLTLGTFKPGEYCLDGYISEVLIYNRGLSDSERLAVEGYLSDKWGMSSVPEPSSLVLLLLGIGTVVGWSKLSHRITRRQELKP